MDEIRGGEVQPGEPYVTVDGSAVTELVRPERGGSGNLSVAEAVIEPGQRTLRHVHRESDEVYYVLSGKGDVSVGGEVFPRSTRELPVHPCGSAALCARGGRRAAEDTVCMRPPVCARRYQPGRLTRPRVVRWQRATQTLTSVFSRSWTRPASR